MFTEEEANALITAGDIITKNKDKSLADQYTNAIDKIKSVLKFSQKDKSELLLERLQIRTNIENVKTSDFLIKLQTAITNYQIVALDYLSLQNQTTKRTIEPFALVHTQDNWILIAFCTLRNNFRAFRLDCIQSLSITSGNFEPHKITLQDYFEQAKKKWKTTPDIPLT